PVEVAHAVVGTGGRGKGGLLERRAHRERPDCGFVSRKVQAHEKREVSRIGKNGARSGKKY
ncbi:hypothetical protein, partial [Burkholderia sp. Bp8984]|uniref:hypothetical protein n=1 Tax=Burkholderia sp. Bp8984 TaxID=2184549 RepID=UPI001C8AC485